MTKGKIVFFSLFMNIILHFGYGNLFGSFFAFGGHTSFLYGIWSLVIFILITAISSAYYKCKKDQGIYSPLFKTWIFLRQDFESLNILPELIDYFKNIPPEIHIIGKGTNLEYREVWNDAKPDAKCTMLYFDYENGRPITRFEETPVITSAGKTCYSEWTRAKDFVHDPKKMFERRIAQNWNKDLIYKYTTWEDASIINEQKVKSYYNILQVSFIFDMDYDKEALEDVQKMKTDLRNEGEEKADNYHISEEYNDEVIKCYADKDAAKRIKNFKTNKLYLVIWLISFLLGYSSIMDSFMVIETKETFIRITKLVSGKNRYRFRYNKRSKKLGNFNLNKKNKKSKKKEGKNFELTTNLI